LYPLAGVGEAGAHYIVAALSVINNKKKMTREVKITDIVQDAILFFLLVSDAHVEFACV